MAIAPLDLVAAHPWDRVTFTTYALSLSFFEAVILDQLVRGGAGQASILADVDGVRGSLGEQGAQRVGKEYRVEPISVSSGVFHPKLAVFSAEDECHLLVGSGNLTFGGWGGNCELIEHLHPSFAAGALVEAAEFFEALSISDRVRHAAAGQCTMVAEALRRGARGREAKGDIRFLHNLERSIREQIVGIVDELGGAERIVVAAPFWDDGSAIDALCAAINLDHVFVHAHSHGCVEVGRAPNWPRRSRTTVQAVRVARFEEEGERRLHAKAFEILCKRGRMVVSGSANASTAALERGRNVEACILRIQQDQRIGWSFSPAEPLEQLTTFDEPDEATSPELGILRAELEEDELVGEVLTPKLTGVATVYEVTTLGLQEIGETVLSGTGSFRLRAPHIEQRAWRGGRLVIRVQAKDGCSAEGFVSVAGFGEIARRVGPMARQLFSMLSGTETPADVAAVMSWFHDNPAHLQLASERTHVSAGVTARAETNRLVSVASLSEDAIAAVGTAPRGAAARNGSWSRFVDQLFAALRENRSPFPRTRSGRVSDDDDDDSGGESRDDDEGERAELSRAAAGFARLFELLLTPGRSARDVLMAFDLTNYVCARTQPRPEQVRAWLDRLIPALIKSAIPDARKSDVAAAVLIRAGVSLDLGAYRQARSQLQHLGIDLDGMAPPNEAVQGLQSVLKQRAPFTEIWVHVGAVRTFGEQVQSYLRAIDQGTPSSEYPDLASAAPTEWPSLANAFVSRRARSMLLVATDGGGRCPECNMGLPKEELEKLRAVHVATAKHCCERIVLWPGGVA